MKKLTEYTMKKHIGRVLVLLSKKDPCGCCPAAYKFESDRTATHNWKVDSAMTNNPCLICQEFSEITFGCPCNIKGERENVKHALLKLEELGYI